MTSSRNPKIQLAACLLFLTTQLWAASHTHAAKDASPSDPGYVSALAAANHFMHAWQTGDLESGMILLSDHIRHTQNADKLEMFFSNGNGADRAFEITRGHGHDGRYTFPVVLVTLKSTAHLTRKFSEITVIETGKNDWVVDKLP